MSDRFCMKTHYLHHALKFKFGPMRKLQQACIVPQFVPCTLFSVLISFSSHKSGDNVLYAFFEKISSTNLYTSHLNHFLKVCAKFFYCGFSIAKNMIKCPYVLPKFFLERSSAYCNLQQIKRRASRRCSRLHTSIIMTSTWYHSTVLYRISRCPHRYHCSRYFPVVIVLTKV